MSYIDSSLDSPLLRVRGGAPQAADNDEGVPNMEPPQAPEDEPEAEPPEPRGPDDGETLRDFLVGQIGDVNLARHLDTYTLAEIGMAVVEEFKIDENSRAEWKDRAEEATKFAAQENEPKQYPWPGAASFIYPLIGQAAVQFNATAYPAIVQGRNVVKGIVWGSDRGTPITTDGETPAEDGSNVKVEPGPNGAPQPVWLVQPGEKRRRADRLGEHMSYQLLVEMRSWEEETDSLLMQAPVMGGAVRKTYRDTVENRNRSDLVSLMLLVWDYNAASFKAAPRHTEIVTLYPHQITELERAGREDDSEEGAFLHLEYGPGGEDGANVVRNDGDVVTHDSADPEAPHVFLEQHRRWDLDGDGYPEPYVITVHQRSSQVVRIVARYDEDGILASDDGETILRIDPVDYYTLYPFFPNLDGGSYPMGFGHLLKNINEGINSSLNQMFDAGHLQNAGGGFIADTMGMASGQVNFQVGEYVRVTTKGQAIRDAVFPIPFQGPSATLMQLVTMLIASGKELASTQAILAGDAAIANAPPTTVLALIEQGLKVYTAIFKRMFRALGEEVEKLYRLNRLYMEAAQTYRVGDENREIHPDDYRLGGGVEPVADPALITDMQRLIRSQVVSQYLGNPLVRQDEIIRRNLEAASVDRIDDLMAPPDPLMMQSAQLELAQKVADLGRTRAAEQKDATQAFLNLANARAKATGPEEAAIAAQMDFLRLHIESLNTAIRAATVDHKFHDTKMRSVVDEAKQASQGANPAEAAATPALPAPEAFPAAPGPSFTGGVATPTPSPEAAPEAA